MPAPGEVNYAGRTIDGRYQVEDVLGKGGMGVVLRVRHKYTGAHAALKLLHPHLRMQGDLAQRFLAEARAPAVIGHPGIVTVVDAGMTPEGELYLVMELLRGRTLAAAIRSGTPAFQDIRRVGADILTALGAAHQAGFIHRDLKPENVFLAEPGSTVKLLDFGIAKVLADGIEQRGETQTGMIMGTVAYMSPEQLRDSRNVDARTDLWAVGVMIYEMVTGRLPYQADTMGNLVVAMMSQPATPLHESLVDVPPALDVFMRRALSVDVHQRFRSAPEMSAALGSIFVPQLHRRHGTQTPAVMVAAPRAPLPAPVFAPPAGSVIPSVPVIASRSPAPASTPPPISASPRPVSTPPPVLAFSEPPPPAPVAKSSAATWIAAIAVLVAVGLGVTLFLVLRERGEPAAVVAVDAAPTPPDAAPTPVVFPDAAPVVVPDAAPPTPPAPTPVVKKRGKKEICADACKKGVKCGWSFATSCTSECEKASERGLACIDRAGANCNALASCSFAEECGSPPSGSAGCAQTAMCMIQCGNNSACACTCTRAMSPAQANLLARTLTCIAAKCSQQCLLGQVQCQTCVQGSCGATATACMVQ